MDDDNNIFDVLESVSKLASSTLIVNLFYELYPNSHYLQAQAMIHGQNLAIMYHHRLCIVLICH